ncbi:MAG: efflux RND transporter periplasmic adaptor subunit [Planctomycetota bacterium]
MSETHLDLRQLAIDRPKPQTSTQVERRWLTRYLVPIGVLLGFAALLSVAAGLQFTVATEVTVCPVIVKRGLTQQAGTPLFQAAGWIEPRPTAITVAALAAGVVEELLVVEGQDVQQGQVIARLITVDAEIEVQQAKATLQKSESERQEAEAELNAAQLQRDNPLHLRLPLAEARGVLAKALTESDKLPYLIEAAETELSVRQRSYEAKMRAGDAVPGSALRTAEGELAAAQANRNELKSRVPNLQREIEALQEKVDVLEKQLALQIDDHGRVAKAEAQLRAKEALHEQSSIRLRQAELDLARMQVVAPIDGRILRVVATPGTRVMGLEHFAGQSSSTVVEMYDPSRLQVRADVRLEDVPLVTPGASVEIKTASTSETLTAVVLQPTSTANIQKNTLEVKVSISEPTEALRPDMLVTATFLAPHTPESINAQNETTRILIPEQLVRRDASDRNRSQQTNLSASVWIIDRDKRAARKTIELGSLQTGGLVEVVSGLEVTDKLIVTGAEGLTPGDRLSVRGDDPVMGVRS